MLDNKTTTDCRNKRIKEAKIRSFLKSVVVCFVRHLTDHYKYPVISFDPVIDVRAAINDTAGLIMTSPLCFGTMPPPVQPRRDKSTALLNGAPKVGLERPAPAGLIRRCFVARKL